MKIAVCLDDNFGMLFNGRRQSRDKEVYEDMIREGGGKMSVLPFSQKLFSEDERVSLFSGDAELLFLEDQSPESFFADELILYFWNRAYPADVYLNSDLESYVLQDTTEFCGSSHQCITKRRYIKK